MTDKQLEMIEKINSEIQEHVYALESHCDRVEELLRIFTKETNKIEAEDLNECIRMGLVPGAKVEIRGEEYVLMGYMLGGDRVSLEDKSSNVLDASCHILLKNKADWKLIKEKEANNGED